MTYREYGHQNTDVILLLHGGGLSWWNYRDAAQLLQQDFRVILPVLDGHGGSDRDFTTIEENAAALIAFIDEHFGGQVLCIGGVSLGGQILLEMLSQRSDICKFALVESALVLPSRLTHAMIAPAFGSCYGLIRQNWFSRLQFRALHIQPKLYDDYYRDTCAITKANMIAFLEANSLYAPKQTLKNCRAAVRIYYGTRETRAIRRSAKRILEMLPGSTLHALPGAYHGAFSINHPDAYAEAIRAMVS